MALVKRMVRALVGDLLEFSRWEWMDGDGNGNGLDGKIDGWMAGVGLEWELNGWDGREDGWLTGWELGNDGMGEFLLCELG